MGRERSPWAVGLAAAGLLAVLLVGYGAAYWWRLDYGIYNPSEYTVSFPSSAETTAFAPAAWIHIRVHSESFFVRTSQAYIRAIRDYKVPPGTPPDSL